MQRIHGLDFSAFAPSFVVGILENRLKATGCGSPKAYMELLAADRSEVETIQRALSVNYSEFFRNPLTFALLEQVIFPELIEAMEKAGRTELRIWSAGCAGGQEAWSVAILLDEQVPWRGRPISFRIFATDLSKTDLDRARAGIYAAPALCNVRLRHLDTYFTRHDANFAIVEHLRHRVEFEVYDLLDKDTFCPPTSVYGNFDLVLCCNVLYFYRPKLQLQILDKLRRSLAPGGYLVTGETERQLVASVGRFRVKAPPAPVFQLTRR